MKKTLTLLSILLLTTSVMAWKPIFVGHRGCIIGVENTRESFIAAKDHYGYEGVETDMMTTKDGKIVMSHDDELSRFGLTGIKIQNKTLAELKALTLTQRRYGKNYSAKILTVDEFCELIDSLGMFPILEIKGSAGLGGAAMQNFPQVYSAIKNHNLEDKAIILTSYQESLEYIRTNYPTIKCQLLRYTLTEKDFQWCKQWGVEPSMCNSGGGNLTQELVKRCHDAGMNVGVWVVDWADVYNSNCGWGCYMCTTDSLTPSVQRDLPEVKWDEICPFSDKLTPIYITRVGTPVAPAEAAKSDTVEFVIQEHKLQLASKTTKQKGGWALRDMSCTKFPTLYTQADYLSTATQQVQYAMERVDSVTVNVYQYDGEDLLAAWNISTSAPLYPAKSVVLSATDVTMNVGDTIWVEATVDPDSCTSEIKWTISDLHKAVKKAEGYKVRIIAKGTGDVTLTCAIDKIKETCTIHIVKATAIEETQATAINSVRKFMYQGQMYIETPKGIFDVLGNPVKIEK